MTCAFCQLRGDILYKDMQDRLYDAIGKWNLLKCPSCGFVWIDPPQSVEHIADLYRGYYTHTSGQPNLPSITQTARKLSISSLLLRYVLQALVRGGFFATAQVPSLWREQWVVPGAKARLLDIGCGNGGFLSAMRGFGWDVVGVEPDAEAAAVAKAKLGPVITNSTLEEAQIPANSFDVITMNHVIEHLPDPIGTLCECYRILKPGGRLVVITPNIESLGHRLFHSDWLHLDPPRHLFLFSGNTLAMAARRASLRVERLQTVPQGAHFAWNASKLIRERKKLPPGWRARVPRRIDIEARIFGLVERVASRLGNTGEELALVAIREEI